jgi:hypothetical protein
MPQSPVLIIDHVEQGQSQKEVTVNEATNILERKITTVSDIDVAGGPITIDLTDDQVRDMRLEFSGVLTGDVTITVPARNMLFMLKNITTGAFVLDFEVIGGGGANIILDRDYAYWVWCDGVDIVDLTHELFDHVTDVATTYQALVNDRKINADAAGGVFTITLPQAAPGKVVLITRVSASNTVTIARGGSDTINGSASSVTIATQWQAIQFVGESATNWLAHRLTVA